MFLNNVLQCSMCACYCTCSLFAEMSSKGAIALVGRKVSSNYSIFDLSDLHCGGEFSVMLADDEIFEDGIDGDYHDLSGEEYASADEYMDEID